MTLNNIFKGELVRLAAPHPDDIAIMTRWTENDDYLRLLDSNPARPLSLVDCQLVFAG